MKKRWLILCGTLALVLVLLCSLFDGDARKASLFRRVNRHQQRLLESVETHDFRGLKWRLPIREIHDRGDHVDFACGASGFGSETAYWGFFYTPDDDLYAVWCAPPEQGFSAMGSGYYWEEENGDNTCYVEPICGSFYYYEASF